jgi:hypothetical protein
MTDLGIPTEGGFRYPVDKPRNRRSVKARRVAESNFDGFWREVDRELNTKGAISPTLKELLASKIIERTPEWVEPKREKTDEDKVALT